MKKLLTFAILIQLLLPASLLAQDLFPVCDAGAGGTEICKAEDAAGGSKGAGLFGPNSTMSNITETVIFIAGAISVLMVVVGGLRYVLSSGDPQATGSAKNTVLYAIIGLVIALAAEILLRLVIQRL